MHGTELRKGSEYAVDTWGHGAIVGVYTGERRGSHQSTRWIIRDRMGEEHPVPARDFLRCLDGLNDSDRRHYDKRNDWRIQALADARQRREESERRLRLGRVHERIANTLLNGLYSGYIDDIEISWDTSKMSTEMLARLLCIATGVDFNAELAFAALQ